MPPTYSHDAGDVARIETQTGLKLLCWLDPQDGGPLIPVLARPELVAAERRRIALRLNGRAAPAPAPPAERSA